MKKIVSVTLSDKSIRILTQTAYALGMSRSKLIDFKINETITPEIMDKVNKIIVLQEELRSDLGL